MYQLVLKNGKVVATHEMYQDVRDKYPGCEIVTYKGEFGGGEWDGDDPRTEEEKKQAYKDKRRLEYPTIEDQLDMIYHDAMDGTSIWQNTVTAIKARYPKPM